MSDNIKIILEGVDGCGKTTLANKIKDKFPERNFKIVHLTRETPNNRAYFEALLFSKENIIFDRLHIGQFVYQTEDQRKANGWMTSKDLEEFEKLINRMKAIVKIIYVDTPTETCLINCKKDAEDSHYTFEYIESLKSKYKEFIKNSKNDILVYHNDFKVVDPNTAMEFDFKSLPYIIGVDYDGVLAVDSFPNLEDVRLNMNLINNLISEQKKGTKIVLWSCRTGDALQHAVESCKEVGLIFDAVNDNIPELISAGLNPRKIYCNEYIDDHASFLCYE